jgi:hypothetical protein
MRLVTIMTIAALAATSACGSSNDKPAGSAAADRAKSPAATASAPAVAKANVPGFSGPVEASKGQATHLYGQCLHSWYAKAGSGTSVHVEYPGPATISVDLTISDESEPPPEAHEQFTLAQGQKVHSLRFPAIPHAGYPQITATSGQKTMTCDAAAKH